MVIKRKRNDDRKIVYTIILAACFIIGAYSSLAITNKNILQTDSSTYIIVPMLMSLLFIFFVLKDDSAKDQWNIHALVLGVLIFAVYLSFLLYASTTMSFEFFSYRIDALLLPILLLSMVTVIFGISGIKKYGPLTLYLLFASPLLLIPFLRVNAQFVGFTSAISYSLARLLGPAAIILTTTNLASAAIPIGTLIAFIMLMAPLTYLFDGSQSRKLIWLVASVILLLALDILIISILSASAGSRSAPVSSAAYAGYAVFCIAAALMLLIHKNFGLNLELGDHWMERLTSSISSFNINTEYQRLAVPVIFAVIALYFSLGYTSAHVVPAISFTNNGISNSSYMAVYRAVSSTLKASNVPFSYLGSARNGGLFFALGNSTNPNASTYMLVSFYPYPEPGQNQLNYTSRSSVTRYLLNDRIVLSEFDADSLDSEFVVNYFAVPYSIQGNAITVNFELFSKQDYPSLCAAALNPLQSTSIETSLFNTLSGAPSPSASTMCYSYDIASAG